MSGTNVPTEPADEGKPDKTPVPAPPSREIRARKWRRRLTRLVVVLVILAVVARAIVQLLFPPVLRKVARIYGLNATYDRLELYLIGGDVGIWGLRFTPIAGGEPVLATSYCRASISELGLLRGHLNVNRVEAEGTVLAIERTADGKIPLVEQFMGAASTPATQPSSTAANRPLSFDAPLTVDVARLQSATAHFRDLSVSPPAEVSLNLDALITDAGSPEKRAKFQIVLNSPEALAALYVTGSGQARNNVLDADISLRMYGLNLVPARAYLAPFGLVPVSHDLTAQANGTFQARITGGAATATQPSTPTNLSATLDLTGLTLLSESSEAAGIDRIMIDASSLAPDAIRLKQIFIAGVRGNASRTPQGNIRVAGIELTNVAPTTQPSKPAPPSSSGGMPFVELKKLLVQDVNLSFVDTAMQPPITLGLRADRLLMTNLCTDPSQAAAPATISVQASAPGLIKSIEVEGSTSLERRTTSLDLSVNASGIDLAAADPYLAAAKINRKFKSGQFTCMLSGTIEPRDDGTLLSSLKLSDSSLVEDNASAFSLPLVEVKGATVDPRAARLSIGDVSVLGPSQAVTLGAKGEVATMGFEYDPAAPGPLPGNEQALAFWEIPVSILRAISVPSISVERLRSRGAAVHLSSFLGPEPLDLSLQDIKVDGDNLIFDPSGKIKKPGRIRITLKAPGVIENSSINGSLTTTPTSLEFDLHGESTGISGKKARPLLNAVGIDPDLNSGTITFDTRGKLLQGTDRWTGEVELGKVRFTDGDTNWLSLDDLAVSGATFDGKTFQVDSVRIDKPTIQLRRDENGVIEAAGIRLLPPKAAPVVTSAPPKLAKPVETRLDLSLPIVAKLKSFELHDASARLIDAAVLPHADVTGNLSLSASDLLFGADGEPSKFSLTLSSPGAIDSLLVNGTFKVAPSRQQIQFAAIGKGLSGKSVEPYLPPNISTRMKDGQFAAILSASFEPNSDGGSRAQLSVTDLAFRDDSSQSPCASLGALRLGVDRLDLARNRIDISEIALEHAMLAASQDDAGLELLGLTLAPRNLRPTPPARPAPEPLAAAGASNVAALVAQANEKAPLITIDKLSLGVDRISFSTPALGAPLAVTNVSLNNTSKIELLGDEPTQRPPFDLRLSAAVEGLIDSITLSGHFAPFASEPRVNLDVSGNGIHGSDITTLLPQFKDLLDGDDLADGQFTATLNAHAAYTRRGQFGIDLSRDITGSFDVKNIRLSQSDKSLAGLDDIRCEGMRFSPASGSLTAKSLDITKPSVSIIRDPKGIHLLGLTVHTAPSTQPAVASNPAPQKSTAPVQVAQHSSAPPPKPTDTEYRIDALTISGGDFDIEDRIGKPTTLLPIKDLDVEVKGLSSRALVEANRPIRFSAIVGAGKVPLPPRQPKAGVTTEDRDVFAEATAAGHFTLVPKPQGFVNASISGFELTSLRGVAGEYGVTLSGATFDGRADVRMNGTDNFVARLYPTFNELRLSEAANGPLQRGLRLPAPPDIIIGALEDPDGSISFPLVVPIEAGKLQWGPIIESATGSLAGVLANAMLAAPLKVANLIPMLGGSDLASKRNQPIPPIVISFDPGESQLTPAQRLQVQRIILILKKNKSLNCVVQHTLGATDVQMVGQRANPPSADILSIVADLRQRKLELERNQLALTGQTTAIMASQNADAMTSAVNSLQSNSVRLKETEDALDEALDLLRPGANRQANRRTKTAAILLANLRLESVKTMLDRAALPEANDRIRKATAVFNPDSSDSPGRVTIVLVRRSNG